MFGFTLDAFSKIETVASLGLEMRMLKDYQMFASDYFRWGHRRGGEVRKGQRGAQDLRTEERPGGAQD